MKAKSLNRLVTIKSQGVQFLEHLSHNGRKLRIDIYTDTYKQQGHCHLEVLDTQAMKWNLVVFKPANSMETEENLCYRQDVRQRNLEKDFEQDRQWLLNIYEDLAPAEKEWTGPR